MDILIWWLFKSFNVIKPLSNIIIMLHEKIRMASLRKSYPNLLLPLKDTKNP